MNFRIKKGHFIYLIVSTGVTLAIYSLVLGEVGYLKQITEEQKASEAVSRLRSLKSENRYLNEQYAFLKSYAAQKKNHFLKPSPLSDIIILKFQDTSQVKSSNRSFLKPSENYIQESRILFLTIMALGILCGYLCIRYFSSVSSARVAQKPSAF